MAKMIPYDVEQEDVSNMFAAASGCPFPGLFNDMKMGEEILKGIMTPTMPDMPPIQAKDADGRGMVSIRKAQDDSPQATNQNLEFAFSYLGVPHPIDYLKAKTLKDISPHHSSCIATKLNSAVGLGFISEGDGAEKAPTVEATANQVKSLLMGESYVQSKVDKILDPFTMHGFSRELFSWTEDELDCGTGYLEIVRDSSDVIEGINWLPVQDLYVYEVRDMNTQRSWQFYRYTGSTYNYGYQRYFAPFGKQNRQRVLDMFYGGDETKKGYISEIIPLMKYSNRSKFYGYPEWLSAAPIIDLLRRAMQYKSDWFTNRGVLDYIFTVAGNVPADEWKKIVAFIQGSVAGGNNFKALALKMSLEAKSELHSLAGNNSKEDAFSKDLDTFSQFIVSAHRVPPVLANILIPGKLGASNEMIQALVAFQLLNCGPTQRNIQATLARTLGHPTDGVPGLTSEDFRLNTITSQFDITGMDTVGKSRSEALDNSEGPDKDRDYSEGVKD